MQLRMQSVSGQSENLPANDDVMDTGHMGDCVSIVVMWNLRGSSYLNVRGFHGFGGLGAINMESVFHDVPDNGRTVVHCFFGSLAREGSDLRNAKPAIRSHVRRARVHYHVTYPNARVKRTGEVKRV